MANPHMWGTHLLTPEQMEFMRARRNRSLVMGFALFGFAAGVFVYSIKAVGQETWEDVDEKGNIIKKERR